MPCACLPKPYWSNTSSNDIVRILVEKSDLSVRREIETLIEGSSITKPVHEDITCEDMQSTQDNLWNCLFFTGYLKKLREFQEEENIYIEMTIPNREAGNGRPDIVLKYPSIRGKAVIIEIKVAGSWKELEKKCTEALKQIEEKNYEAELRREGYQDIMKYGVAFYRKECMVKSG